MEKAGNDFGWRMYVNNPFEDVTKPKYIENSINLSLTTREVQNQLVDSIIAKWQIEEDNPKENQGCYGALNDEFVLIQFRDILRRTIQRLSTKFLFHRVCNAILHAFRYLQIKLYFSG